MCFFKRMNKKERNCIYKCERAELVIGDLLWLSSSCLICASRVSVSPTIPNLCPVFVCVCCACPRLLVLNGRKLYCEMTGDDVELCIRYATMRSLSPISLSVSPIFVLPGFQKPRPGEALTVQNKATVAIPSAVYTSSVDRRPVTQAATGCFNSRLRWRRPSSKVVMSYFRVLFPPARRGFAFMSRTRCCCCWPARSWQSVDGENPRWWSSPVPGGGKINCFGSLRRISKSFILFFFLMGEPNEKKVRLSFFDWWGLRRQD